MDKSKYWVIWCRSRENTRLKPMEKNLLKSQQASKSQSRREDGLGRRQRAVSALESVVATEQYQMRSERRVCFVLGSPRLPSGISVEYSGRSIKWKRRMSSVIERERTRLLDGHRDRHAQRLWVSGPSNGR